VERLDIICIGSLKEKFMRDMCGEYIKRLSRYCTLKITELPESRLPQTPSHAEIARALEKEGEHMLAAAPSDAFKIALCIEGEQMSSEKLSKTLNYAMACSGKTALFIGSSYGLSERLKGACRLRMSMSRMTFPHQLARCMLLEQLYRSYKIRRNEVYHK